MISRLGCSVVISIVSVVNVHDQHALLFPMIDDVKVPTWQPDFEAEPFPTSMFITEG